MKVIKWKYDWLRNVQPKKIFGLAICMPRSFLFGFHLFDDCLQIMVGYTAYNIMFYKGKQ